MPEIQNFLNQVLFQLGGEAILLRQLLAILLSAGLIWIFYRMLLFPLLMRLLRREELDDKKRHLFLRDLRFAMLTIYVLLVVWILRADYAIFENEYAKLRISNLLQGLLIFQIARLGEWVFTRFILRKYFDKRQEKLEKTDSSVAVHGKPENVARRLVRYLAYTLAILLIIDALHLNYSFEFLSNAKGQPYNISLINIMQAIMVLLVARLIVWVVVQLILYGYYHRKEINIGSQYAINQLISYVVYVIAALIAMSYLGIQMTVILGGAAALLVGVGLGLQQVFNDLISGIILLFERTVEVGDVVKVNDLVGRVKRIGLRTSVVETWDNVAVLVPNSHFVSDQIINYSHSDIKTRFHVSVGVAYGSDTELVKKLLLQAAEEVKFVLSFPSPLVRFVSFGNSSLDFELHFWTHRLVIVENTKSDLHFVIDRLFREHGVNIPFPQRDLWVRNWEKGEGGEK